MNRILWVKLGFYVRFCGGLWHFEVNFRDFPPDFYGMEWSWVGAFTDFRGSGYRNPVQISAHFPIFPLILGFPGLV